MNCPVTDCLGESASSLSSHNFPGVVVVIDSSDPAVPYTLPSFSKTMVPFSDAAMDTAR